MPHLHFGIVVTVVLRIIMYMFPLWAVKFPLPNAPNTHSNNSKSLESGVGRLLIVTFYIGEKRNNTTTMESRGINDGCRSCMPALSMHHVAQRSTCTQLTLMLLMLLMSIHYWMYDIPLNEMIISSETTVSRCLQWLSIARMTSSASSSADN